MLAIELRGIQGYLLASDIKVRAGIYQVVGDI